MSLPSIIRCLARPTFTSALQPRLGTRSSVILQSRGLVTVKHTPNFKPLSTEELTEFRERAREFTKREIPEEVAAKVDKSNEFPQYMWKKIGDAGFLGITVEEQYGGVEMGYQAHCIAMEEISRASGSIGLSYAAHSQLCCNQLTLHGTPEQKERFLPGLVAGTKVGALAMSEHSAGSDVVGMKTTAKQTDDGGWLLNGSKMWITNGPDADYVIVYAKTDPQAGSKGITAFVVETKTSPGFSCTRKLDKLGMRGSNTGELVFEDVYIPPQNRLGGLNAGVKILMSGLDLERLVLSAGPVGIMQACLDLSLPYIHTRTQFNHPIAHTQLMQALLSKMHIALATSRSYTMSTARTVDEQSILDTRDCAGTILHAAESATQCALDAIQCLGGMGYVNEIPAGRLLRDAKLYEIGAGTTQIRQIVIGRAFNRDWKEGRIEG